VIPNHLEPFLNQPFITSFTTQLIFLYFIYREQRNRETGKLVREKYGIIDFGEYINIIWILDKSGSVAPAKLETRLVSP
jgi:hypothetical protein